MMRRLALIPLAVAFLAVSLASMNGCVGQQQAPVQQQVSIAQPVAPPPPTPPSGAELEKPPNVVLEKPSRDPFVPLAEGGTVAKATTSAQKVTPVTGTTTAGSYSVTGIMFDRESSAIIDVGTNSYIVHAGDKIDGYRVGSITPKGVVLVGKGGKLSLSLPSGP